MKLNTAAHCTSLALKHWCGTDRLLYYSCKYS